MGRSADWPAGGTPGGRVVSIQQLGPAVSLAAAVSLVVSLGAGRLARGARAPWAPSLPAAWCALAAAGLVLGLGLEGVEVATGVQAVSQAWVALGLCLLCAAGGTGRRGSRQLSTWRLLSPLPLAVLTVGLLLPGLRSQVSADGIVAGFAGGAVGSVPLSVLLLGLQAVLLLGVVGVWQAWEEARNGEPGTGLGRLGAAVGRGASLAWLAVAVWPRLLPVAGGLAAAAGVCVQARPSRVAEEGSGPLSSLTLRAFLKANRRMGAALRAIEAEVVEAAAREEGSGATPTPRLLRRLRGAHALAARLSQVSRQEPGPRTLDSLAAIVDRAARRVDNPNEVVLRIRSRGTAGPGLVDADGVELALAALLQNAVDAQDAAKIRVPVELEIDSEVPPPPAAQHLAGAVRVRVLDSGAGLTEAERSACFEPFFTTRADREGLGLSVVGALVRVGDAQVDLAPRSEGRGTCATLWLRWPRPGVTDLPQWTESQSTSGGAEVLLVAADARRRELLTLMLEERGVVVAAAADWRTDRSGAQPAPRPWGLVVFPDASEPHEAAALVAWLSGLYAFVVAPSVLADQLAASGLPEGRLQRTVGDRAEGVVEVVLKGLTATRGSAPSSGQS